MEDNLKRSSIKNWLEDDRPREKLLLKGKNSLSDAELIAILIASGSKNESAVDLSKRILKSVEGNLIELSKLSVNELEKFKGIGEAKAISIVAALELGSRRRGAEALERKSITSSHDAFEVLQMHVADPNYEQFFVILLNRGNKVLKTVIISEGGVTGTVVDPKKIFKIAIENGATSLILGHNHPSGNTTPSSADINLTDKIVGAGKLLDINILDHIIIGADKYYSFADNGQIS
ncbi:MAG TPA: DNA repair protein RadC [Bacteroidales bacterium]|nr:DNA repair protein RadC [Bacteroidales bacterium]HRW97153.1 DNA repair protein RadC [Bacteroidales bacterium]